MDFHSIHTFRFDSCGAARWIRSIIVEFQADRWHRSHDLAIFDEVFWLGMRDQRDTARKSRRCGARLTASERLLSPSAATITCVDNRVGEIRCLSAIIAATIYQESIYRSSSVSNSAAVYPAHRKPRKFHPQTETTSTVPHYGAARPACQWQITLWRPLLLWQRTGTKTGDSIW